MSLSSYEIAKRRVLVYCREVLHQSGSNESWKRILPQRVAEIVGFKTDSHAEAVRFVIQFAQTKVVWDVWSRRRKLNRRPSAPADEFYSSLAWKKLRYQALVRSSGKCQCCGGGGDKSTLHVDHIKPRSKYPELALVLDNLQVLCADCNIGKMNQDETDWRKPLLRVVK